MDFHDNKEQQLCFFDLKNKKNIVISAAGGCGKTRFILKSKDFLRQNLNDDSCIDDTHTNLSFKFCKTLCPTGISALNTEGITYHSAFYYGLVSDTRDIILCYFLFRIFFICDMDTPRVIEYIKDTHIDQEVNIIYNKLTDEEKNLCKKPESVKKLIPSSYYDFNYDHSDLETNKKVIVVLSFMRQVINFLSELKQYNDSNCLFFDEISMINPRHFILINIIFKILSNNFETPFGGKQVVLVGDFAQLKPVKCKELLFETQIWIDLKLKHHVFTKNYRQKSYQFQNVLNKIREGNFKDEDVQNYINMIKKRPKFNNEEDSVHLCHSNKEKNEINQRCIAKLEKKYSKECHTIEIIGIDKSFNIKKVEKLEMKVKKFFGISTLVQRFYLDEKVMCIKNNNFEYSSTVSKNTNTDANAHYCKKKIYNGQIGIIKGFDKYNMPIVLIGSDKNKNKEFIYFKPIDFTEERGSYKAIPLIPSYAITIHKCQGITFEYDQKVTIYDTDRKFEALGYVALSRCSNSKNVRLKCKNDTMSFNLFNSGNLSYSKFIKRMKT